MSNPEKRNISTVLSEEYKSFLESVNSKGQLPPGYQKVVRNRNRIVKNPAAIAKISTSKNLEQSPKITMPCPATNTRRKGLANYNVQEMTKQTLVMKTGEADINLEPEKALVYTCFNTNYDKSYLLRADVWHQILIHHDGKYDKQQILHSLFSWLNNEDFYPVAYREYANVDFFLLRVCNKAIIEMFEKNLKLIMHLETGSDSLNLTVKLNIAKYQMKQIFPIYKIQQAVNERCDNAIKYGFLNLLNLDSFHNHQLLEEVSINLFNKFHLDIICQSILNIDTEKRSRINCLKITNNNLMQITPLSMLSSMQIQSLDLRFNKLKHPAMLRVLKGWTICELYVEGNGLTDVPNYVDVLKEYFPNVLKIDDNILSVRTAAKIGGDDEVDTLSDGDVYKSTSKMEMSQFHKYQKSPKWHQIVVCHGGNYEKEEILESIYDLVEGFDFYPCYYKTYSRQDEFLIYNCFDAIVHIMKKKLMIRMKCTNETIPLILKMNVADRKDGQIVLDDKINQVLQECYSDRILDLNNAQRHFNGLQHIDINFSSIKTICKVLTSASRRFGSLCLSIRLRSNNIKSLKFMTSISLFTKLVALDLRKNQISDLDEIKTMCTILKIKELYLDHNPICNTIETVPEYIDRIRDIFPHIEKLDGVTLREKSNFIFAQNYICVPEAYKFAECFVKHFFQIYDSFQRSNLHELYDPKALFSMTCNLNVKFNDFFQTRMDNYMRKSRNLLRLANIEHGRTNLVIGPENIVAVFKSFAQTEHDPYSFKIDVPIFTAQYVVLTVSGVFKELGKSLLSDDFMLGFSRTFFIRPCAKGLGIFEKAIEYKIYNEQLHIHKPSLQQKDTAFKHNEEEETIEQPAISPHEDRENNLIVFQELTKLTRSWCIRCLEESSYNLKVALNVFIKLYEEDKIPETGFDKTLLKR